MKHLCYGMLGCCVCFLSVVVNGMAEQVEPTKQLVEMQEAELKKQLVRAQQAESDERLAKAQKLDSLRMRNPLLFAQLCAFLRLTDRTDYVQFMEKLVQYGLDPDDQDLGSVMDEHLVGEGLDMRFEVKVMSEKKPGSVPNKMNPEAEGA